MKRSNIIMILFLLLTSCALSSTRTTEVTDPNQRYETGGVSFLSPAGGGWKITRHKPTGRVTFAMPIRSGYAHDSRIYRTVTILPFINGYKSNDFNEKLRLYTKSVTKFNSNHKDTDSYQKINVVRKAGMRCIRIEHSYKAYSYSEVYTCERQPNQTQDVPLIEITSTFRNSDEILEPIWKSIKFKPIEKYSQAYINWKKR